MHILQYLNVLVHTFPCRSSQVVCPHRTSVTYKGPKFLLVMLNRSHVNRETSSFAVFPIEFLVVLLKYVNDLVKIPCAWRCKVTTSIQRICASPHVRSTKTPCSCLRMEMYVHVRVPFPKYLNLECPNNCNGSLLCRKCAASACFQFV